MKRSYERLTPTQVRRLSHQLRIDREHTQPDVDRANRAYFDRSRRRPTRPHPIAIVILVLMIILAISALPASVMGSPAPAPPRSAPRMDPLPTPTPEATPESLRGRAVGVAVDERVDQRIFLALIQAESAWRVDARGAAGEIGLTQLLPSTARELGVDAHDVQDNLVGGARYLRGHFDRTGDWKKALAAYNGRGPRARAYARRVLRAAAAVDPASTGGEQ